MVELQKCWNILTKDFFTVSQSNETAESSVLYIEQYLLSFLSLWIRIITLRDLPLESFHPEFTDQEMNKSLVCLSENLLQSKLVDNRHLLKKMLLLFNSFLSIGNITTNSQDCRQQYEQISGVILQLLNSGLYTQIRNYRGFTGFGGTKISTQSEKDVTEDYQSCNMTLLRLTALIAFKSLAVLSKSGSGKFLLFLFVFYIPSTVRSFRNGTPVYCPLQRT